MPRYLALPATRPKHLGPDDSSALIIEAPSLAVAKQYAARELKESIKSVFCVEGGGVPVDVTVTVDAMFRMAVVDHRETRKATG